jgi:hypothetical protein
MFRLASPILSIILRIIMFPVLTDFLCIPPGVIIFFIHQMFVVSKVSGSRRINSTVILKCRQLGRGVLKQEFLDWTNQHKTQQILATNQDIGERDHHMISNRYSLKKNEKFSNNKSPTKINRCHCILVMLNR